MLKKLTKTSTSSESDSDSLSSHLFCQLASFCKNNICSKSISFLLVSSLPLSPSFFQGPLSHSQSQIRLSLSFSCSAFSQFLSLTQIPLSLRFCILSIFSLSQNPLSLSFLSHSDSAFSLSVFSLLDSAIAQVHSGFSCFLNSMASDDCLSVFKCYCS